MKRWFAAAGLLLLFLACVAMGWLAACFATSTPPTATSLATDAVRADREPAGSGTDGRGPGADGARIAADDATNVRRIEVLVVATDGNPVAGATIRYWPIRTPAERERDDAVQHASQDDPEVALARTGASRATDARGVAWIDAASLDPEQGSELIARHGDLYGTRWVGATDQRLLLEVRRDVCLDIEVVDSLGRARQGQVVEIEAECLSRRQGLCRGSMRTDATDADGRVRIAHAQLDLGLDESAVAGRIVAFCERRTPASVRLAEKILDLSQLGPTSDIRLVVPAGGSIAVRVTDASGADVDADIWLCDDHDQCFDLRPATHDDKLWFHGLPLRHRWTLVARAGLEHDTLIPVIGPASADEVVQVTILLPLRRWEFRGRLVRNDGHPVPCAKVQWTCAELSVDCEFTTSIGDSPMRLGGTSGSLTEVTHMELRVDSPLVAPQRFRFDGRYLPGLNDLGDLVLSPPANERLLASLEVRCDGKSITEGAWARLLTGSREANDEAEPPCVLRRASDHIEMHGVPPDRPVLLACGHDECLGIRVPIAIGEHRVIDLQRAARLRLATVPPEVPWDALAAHLQCLDTAGDPVAASLDGAAQTFDWRWLVPGRYRLRIEAFGRTVHEEPELRLAPGANDWPADRSRLDLRGRLRASCIVAHSAADPSKQLYVSSIVVPIGADLPANFNDGFPPYDNTFVPSPTAADLLVRAPEFVPVRVRDPRGDVVLGLQPLTQLEFPATGPGAIEIRVRVVVDGVRDPLLRAFDTCNDHEPEQDNATTNRLAFAPGTELDLCVLRGGKPGPPQRIVIGTTSPQPVVLR